MALAADVLTAVAPDEQPPESVRAEGVPPRAVRVASIPAAMAEVVGAELADMGDSGRLAVIAPGERLAELAAALPEAVRGDHPDVLDSQVALLSVGQAKGLEFDRVVLADPAGILAQSPAGGHDLYVAITRATHRLTLLTEGELPSVLGRLRFLRLQPQHRRRQQRHDQISGGKRRWHHAQYLCPDNHLSSEAFDLAKSDGTRYGEQPCVAREQVSKARLLLV